MSTPLLKINGVAMKNVAPLFDYETEQLVSETRNANGSLTATKINRRAEKLTGLEWRNLTRDEAGVIFNLINDFYSDVTYFSPRANNIITVRCYWGDSSCEVLDWDRTGEVLVPKRYLYIKCNIIDTLQQEG